MICPAALPQNFGLISHFDGTNVVDWHKKLYRSPEKIFVLIDDIWYVSSIHFYFNTCSLSWMSEFFINISVCEFLCADTYDMVATCLWNSLALANTKEEWQQHGLQNKHQYHEITESFWSFFQGAIVESMKKQVSISCHVIRHWTDDVNKYM